MCVTAHRNWEEVVAVEGILTALQQAHQLAAGGALWPGFDLADIPIVIYDRAEALLVGHPAPPPGYEPAGTVAGRAMHRGATLPEMAANTAALVNGQLSALVSLPDAGPADEAAFVRLILHEAFHVFQQTALSAMPRMDQDSMRVMSEYPENDAANNAMAVVENQLLARALAGEDGAAAAFLAMRQHRHRRLVRLDREEVVIYEQTVEWVEGTPTYIELRAGAEREALAERLRQHSRGGQNAALRRFYDTGAAQALLLDQYAPGWQAALRSGATLQALLAEAVPQPWPTVNQVVVNEGFAGILEAEEQAEAQRRERIAALLRALEEGAGVRVEVHLPPQVTGVMWDPTNLLNIGPGRRLHTRFCGALGPGGLKVTIEALCLEEWGPGGRRFTFRLPVMPTVHRGADANALADPPGATGGPLVVQGGGLSVTVPSGRCEVGDGSLQIWVACA